jgi:hypothetical protein
MQCDKDVDSLVHKACRAELDLVKASVTEHLAEAPLVVIVSMLLGRVYATNIDNNVQWFD